MGKFKFQICSEMKLMSHLKKLKKLDPFFKWGVVLKCQSELS